jgi:hypothetical protein
VRHPVAEEVKEQSEWQRAEPRTDERAAGSTGRNVKGDDQAASLAVPSFGSHSDKQNRLRPGDRTKARVTGSGRPTRVRALHTHC